MKRLAVVVGGWHFPLHPYQALAAQQIPKGWAIDFFCVSHRDPRYSAEEKAPLLASLGYSYRAALDRVLYAEFATPEKIRALGFDYKEHPNTMGDWAMTNQWLAEHDYRDYDALLVTHDDNIFPTDQMLVDLLEPDGDWLVITNSQGLPLSLGQRIRRWGEHVGIRGSFEFMKREMLERIGGAFDMGEVSLVRVGENYSPTAEGALKDWNKHVQPFLSVLREQKLFSRVRVLSPHYRVSKYCIEGERGFVSFAQKRGVASENDGFVELDNIEWKKHIGWLASFYQEGE